MIETMGAWLRQIVISSLLLSVINSMIPEGSFRKVAGFVSGLIFLSVVFKPIYTIDWENTEIDLESYRAAVAEKQLVFEEENDQKLSDVIAGKTETYILDKAADLGIACTVTVETTESEDGVFLPAEVYFDCSRSDMLEGWVEENLGIPPDHQYWETNEEGAG